MELVSSFSGIMSNQLLPGSILDFPFRPIFGPRSNSFEAGNIRITASPQLCVEQADLPTPRPAAPACGLAFAPSALRPRLPRPTAGPRELRTVLIGIVKVRSTPQRDTAWETRAYAAIMTSSLCAEQWPAVVKRLSRIRYKPSAPSGP